MNGQSNFKNQVHAWYNKALHFQKMHLQSIQIWLSYRCDSQSGRQAAFQLCTHIATCT